MNTKQKMDRLLRAKVDLEELIRRYGNEIKGIQHSKREAKKERIEIMKQIEAIAINEYLEENKK